MTPQLPLSKYYIGEWYSYPEHKPPSKLRPDGTPTYSHYLVYDTMNKKVLVDTWIIHAETWNHYDTNVLFWTPLPRPPIKQKTTQ